jgi:hypothetical protein
MSGEAHVTIKFRTTLPIAMVADWPAALGLLDPKKMRDLQIDGFELEVEGDTRLGPPTPVAPYHGGEQPSWGGDSGRPPLDPFTAPVLVSLRRLLCFFPGRSWHVHANGMHWLLVDFEPAWGEEATAANDKRSFSIWLNTGDVYRVDSFGAAEDDPIPLDLMDPEKDRL